MENKKVYVVHMQDKWDGDTECQIKVFDTIEKARQQKQKWIDEDCHFIDDIMSTIENGNEDSRIENEEDYFYAYDGLNFDSKFIEIIEREIE